LFVEEVPVMTVADVVPAFLAVCPAIGPAWQEYLAFWGDQPDRGAFNDAAVLAHHIVDSYERGEVSEFPAVFAVLEACLAEGDEQVCNLVKVGVIEDIQNTASHREFGQSVFCQWLGPLSRAAWDEVNGWWEQLAETKAAGLLEHPPSPVVDPGDVQDPALRRMIEQLYRK
jgi:hypothetical protein